ncbi:hypothetical protein OPV22_014845 [Ensete ventricosum]|uniref:YABBY N-terminal domain-containing protein n=1 Tax=Ensete ventricosum TaxID=4639 RepID=A0AAV8R455_ENSVE|nr:hypothetical protein OPV22_014845 [Ensete ventricosum]
MDLVSPAEHLCYIRCTYCHTLLAVGVPRRWLMDSVTVHCGHCNHLSFLNPRDVIQCLCPAGPQMGFQGPCTGLMMEPPSLRSSSSVPKKHRAPSAYNHFMSGLNVILATHLMFRCNNGEVRSTVFPQERSNGVAVQV